MSSEIVGNGFPIDGFKLFIYKVAACKGWSFFRKCYLWRFMDLGEEVRKESSAGKKRGMKQCPPGQTKMQRMEGEYVRQYYEQ